MGKTPSLLQVMLLLTLVMLVGVVTWCPIILLHKLVFWVVRYCGVTGGFLWSSPPSQLLHALVNRCPLGSGCAHCLPITGNVKQEGFLLHGFRYLGVLFYLGMSSCTTFEPDTTEKRVFHRGAGLIWPRLSRYKGCDQVILLSVMFSSIGYHG